MFIRGKVMTNKRSEKCLSDLRLVQEIKIHQGVVWVMQFSPNHNMLATGGEDGNVYIWHVMENRFGTALAISLFVLTYSFLQKELNTEKS